MTIAHSPSAAQVQLERKARALALAQVLEEFSTLVDYYGSYPEWGRKFLGARALLDTHDALTDY